MAPLCSFYVSVSLLRTHHKCLHVFFSLEKCTLDSLNYTGTPIKRAASRKKVRIKSTLVFIVLMLRAGKTSPNFLLHNISTAL